LIVDGDTQIDGDIFWQPIAGLGQTDLCFYDCGRGRGKFNSSDGCGYLKNGSDG
jgi:hypothetical protein